MISNRRDYRGGRVRPSHMEAYVMIVQRPPHKSGNRIKMQTKKKKNVCELRLCKKKKQERVRAKI